MVSRLLVVHPHLTVKGGSERLTKILVEELSKLGIDIYLVTASTDQEWFSKELSPQVTTLKSSSDVAREMLTVLTAYEPDTVLVMIQEPYYCYIAKRAREEVATCMYVHFPLDEEISEENLEEYTKYSRYPHLTAKCLNYVDKVIVNSRRTGLAVKFLWGFEPYVVYPCIDSKFFSTEPPLGSDREPTILYVGRFTTLKRHDFLALIFPLVKREVPSARLVLTGYVDPRHREYYEHVKAIVDELQDRYRDVELIPSPSEETLLELYHSARVYVHPRIGEHFGLAPLEAMSQGVPVVVRAPTGLAEVIEHGREGYLAWSDYELVKYLIHVLKLSREEWFKLQYAAYLTAQRFHPKTFAEAMLKVLRS